MSDFSIQCVASKININNGDPIVVFPIYLIDKYRQTIRFNQPDGSVMELNQPEPYTYGGRENNEIGIPFMAQYNGQGGYTVTRKQREQIGLSLFIQDVVNNALEISKETSERNTDPFYPKKISLDMDECIRQIHNTFWRGELFIQKEHQLYPVQFAYMHKSVYDYILSKEKPFLSKARKEIKNYFDHALQYAEARDLYMNGLKMKDPDYSLTERYYKLSSQIHIASLEMGVFSPYYIKSSMDELPYVSKRMKGFNRLLDNNQFEYYWEPEKKAELQSIFKSMTNLCAVTNHMDNKLNIGFETVRTCDTTMGNEAVLEFQEFTISLMRNQLCKKQ